MNSWVIQFKKWWRSPEKPGTRLVVAVILSLVFHVTLLLLQFGEYGEGLPGFALPSGDRRARAEDLHLNLQKNTEEGAGTSVSNNNVDPAAMPLPSTIRSLTVPVIALDVVPEYKTVETPVVVVVKAPAVKAAPHAHRVAPKLIISAAENSDFKVAESEQPKLEAPVADEDKSSETKISTEIPEVANPAATEIAEADNREKELADKAIADKLAEEKRAQERQIQEKLTEEKLMAEKQGMERQAHLKEQLKLQEAAELADAQKLAALEQEKLKKLALEKQQADLKAAKDLELQRQAQMAAQLAEKIRQDELAKKQEQAELDRIEREKAQQNQLAERIAIEQRKLAEAVRAEQLKQEQLKQEQVNQEQAKREQLERQLLEKRRIEQEALKQQQEQEKLLTEQAQLREAARQLEARRAAAEADARNKAEQTTQSNDLDDVLGASRGSSAGVNAGNGKQDMDKLLSGRSFDFDKTGEAVKSSSGTTVPMPKFETSPGARRSLFGSKNGDVDLNLYILSWRQKIESNGRLNYSQSAKDKIHSDPIVVVSVRADGSVENVVILRSSGRKEIDDAVRRIAIVNAPYSAFPPSLARRYDVIDIRQTWIFNESLRVTDEMR